MIDAPAPPPSPDLTHTRHSDPPLADPTGDQLPPHDGDVEAGALACVLTAGASDAGPMLDKLAIDSFYDERHRVIFPGLRYLRLDGKKPDVVNLTLWLKAKGQVQDAGGLEYITSLPDKTPSPANFPAFLDAIEGYRGKRAAIHDATELERLAYDPSITPVALADAHRRMLEANAERGSNSNLPAILDAADWLATPADLPSELVCGLLHRGSKLVLGGGSKTFKTWTLLDLAISVSAGTPWLSCKTAGGRVLYLNFEIPPAFFQRRIGAIARAKGIALAPHTLEVWNLRGRATGYAEILPKIQQRIKGADYALLVLDPIYKLYGNTDENNAGEVAGLMNALELVAVDTGAAIAFGAHYAKGNAAGKEAIDRISGSGVFARDPDSILNFTRHETEDAFTVEATLRNLAPIKPFVVRWQFPLMVADGTLDPSKLKRVGGRKQEHSADDLLGVLGGQSLTTTEWQSTAKTEAGIGERSFYTLLKELQQSGRVLKSAINRKWQRVSK